MQQQTENNQCRRPSQNDEPPTARTPLTLDVNHRVKVISQPVHYLVHPFRHKSGRRETVQPCLSPLNPEIRPSNEKSFTNPYTQRYHLPCSAKFPSSAHGARTLSFVVGY